jgi:hypothetical protein
MGGTLVYAPGIRVTIATASKGILDVSDDISNAQIALQTGKDGGHQLTLNLTNIRRKYDGVFTPNDRIVVHLKRIRWLQIMSGYLNSVPMYSVYSGGVALSASCTLKRPRLALYDPGSQEIANLLNSTNDATANTSSDSNIDEKIVKILTEVVGWEREKIHIGGIPVDWFEEIRGLYRSLETEFNAPSHLTGLTAGHNIAQFGQRRIPSGSPGEFEEGPGYGWLPSYTGKITAFPAGAAYTIKQPQSAYFASMRWGYEATGPTGAASNFTTAQKRTAEAWWGRQRLLVSNPATNKGVVVEIVSWGPQDSSKQMQLSDAAKAAIGVQDDAFVDITFATTQLPTGPFTPPPESANLVTNPQGLLNGQASNQSIETSVVAEEGITFVAAGQDKPHVNAARQFIKKNWNPPNGNSWSIGGYRASSSYSKSDHHTGHALDVMVSSGEPSDAQVAVGNQIAYWFTQNPGVFGVKYVIWNNQIYTPNGVKRYTSSSYNTTTDPTGAHRDHVHISFEATGQTSLGPTGDPWPVAPSDFMNSAALGGVIHQNRVGAIASPSGANISGAGSPSQLVSAWNWYQMGDPLSATLAGPRVLLNDIPVIGLLNQMFDVGMREYCSAPNGDIIAWFPDFFNLYGVLSRMVVQTVELERFAIQWSDASLITHQFVTGSHTGFGSSNVAAEFAARQQVTHGIATIEYPELLKTLLNVDINDPASAGWITPEAILQRFGARVKHQTADWATSPEAEFWMAVHLFRKNWASQFSTQIPLAFMPELFPGMILQIPEYGIQFYVAQVEHTVDLGNGGQGFATSARCIAPSTIGTQAGLYGLPRGGSWIGAQEKGPSYGPRVNPADTSRPTGDQASTVAEQRGSYVYGGRKAQL